MHSDARTHYLDMKLRQKGRILRNIFLLFSCFVVLTFFSRSSMNGFQFDTYTIKDDWDEMPVDDMFVVNATHTSVKFVNHEQSMKVKLDQIDKKCQDNSHYWKKIEPHGKVWNYRHIYYCIVPKIGCTYWKRIITFVSHSYPQHAGIWRPSDIDRHFVHFEKLPKIRRFNMKDDKERLLMTNKAFMFTRDPYARLWSAYIDKFLLPDFWGNGEQLIKALKPNPTKRELACISHLSFRDFLTAISTIWPKELNEHWEPVHSLCSPCHVQYAAIGKMETFANDAEYIIEKYSINLQQNITKREVMFEEINTLTKYNFDLETGMVPNCFYKMDVAKRLWKAFQFNGYIDRYMPFPRKEFEKSDFLLHPTQSFVQIAKKTINRQTRDIKSQRRDMMLEAYKEIPEHVLDEIKNVYKFDFELFGYEKELFK